MLQTFISFLIFATVADTRWTGSVTKDRNSITNNTQILPAHSIKTPQTSNVDDLSYKEEQDVSSKGQLLVGFGGNPFKDSIPATDYWKGIRTIEPDSHTNTSENRSKRSIIELYNIIKCGSGCNAFNYISYGCYCGLGGFGTPVDGIDECCLKHDLCYSALSNVKYILTPYYWYCDSDRPWCSYKYNDDNAYRLCQCDREIAECLYKYNCPSSNPRCFCSPFCRLRSEFWS